MSLCPHCGVTNKPTAKFCGKCGKPLSQAGWKKCKNGHSYQGDECPHCPKATRVESGQAPNAASPFHIPKEETKVGDSKRPRDITVVKPGQEDAPQRLVGWLVVIKSDSEKTYNFFPLHDGRNTIRRAGKGHCSVAIKDQAVTGEKHHALLDHEEGTYYITDHGSSAGTRLNGKMIRRDMELQDGDQIQVGNTTLSFRSFQVVAEGD